MSQSNARFSMLRTVLHSEPSEEAWSRLCTALGHIQDEELKLAQEYVLPLLNTWPTQLRTYRCTTI
ncbi:MAG: hypothetical protein AAFX99_36745, partial [Myxococcota bacterium]